jgi:D-serine deaminase-like pyridoxal phosphate-dependent protein
MDALSLPSPSFVVVKPAFERNCARMAAAAKALGLALRPHVKVRDGA